MKKGKALQAEFSPNDEGEDILETVGLFAKNVNGAIKRINN